METSHTRAKGSAKAQAVLGGSLDGLSDEVVELLVAMKMKQPPPGGAAAAQHELKVAEDDPPGFWTTTSESGSESESEPEPDHEKTNPAAKGDLDSTAPTSGEANNGTEAQLEGTGHEDPPDSCNTFSPEPEPHKRNVCAGNADPNAPSSVSGDATRARVRTTTDLRPNENDLTVEAKLNRRRRMQRLAAPTAGTAFASSHPELWLALQVGLDKDGFIDSACASSAISLPSAEHGSIAENPLGERGAKTQSTVPFELEAELDLAALVAPSCWAPAPCADGLAPMERVRADLEPLLLSANRAVQFAWHGAPRSAALTLQTITDNLFINCERYGLRNLATWRETRVIEVGQLQRQERNPVDEIALGISQQWNELEQLLQQAWHVVLCGSAEPEAGIKAFDEQQPARSTGPDETKEGKKLAPGDAALLERWAGAWSRCLDPASVWSDHKRTWVSTRGLVLTASPGISKGTSSHSSRPVSVGWPGPVDGLVSLPAVSPPHSRSVEAEKTKRDDASTLVATLGEPLLQIAIDDLSIGRQEFVRACERCDGVPGTFGEPERPAIYRWYGLFGISAGFGGGFEAVAMRESGTSQQVRIRRWMQLMQLEWRSTGETVAQTSTKEAEELGEVVLWGWTWAAGHRGRHGIWSDA